MTLKFRCIQNGEDYLVQVKKWYGWVYKITYNDYMTHSWQSRYETEAGCIDRVLRDCKIKRESLRLIQYPSLKIL